MAKKNVIISFVQFATKPLSPVVQKICREKAVKINEAIHPYVKGKVLDVGAGRCYVSKEVQTKNKDVEVTCLDVDNYNMTDMKLILYDGKKIPFPDNNFDTLMLIYVLHHVENPVEVLKECIRVCKGNIIITEDPAGNFFVKAIDYIYNNFHGVDCPFNFKSDIEWIILFNKLGLDIVHIQRGVEKEWFSPVEHILFVLKKRA